MPLFILNARDKANSLPLRMENRAAHLEWAASFRDVIRMAGPVFAEDGTSFAGSVFVLDMENLQAVKDWASEDPYAKAGLFETVEIKHFAWLMGEGKADT